MSDQGKTIKKILRFKKDTSDDVINKAEEDIKKLGGVITGKTTLTGKTLMFNLPANTVTTFDSNEHVDSVEDDGVVTTQ